MNIRKIVLLLAFLLLVTFFVGTRQSAAQSPMSCLPTCDETDGRFFSLAGCSLHTLGVPYGKVELVVPATTTTFTFEIFDGDAGGHWDLGTTPLTFALYADPKEDGSGALLVGQWPSTAMTDNDWFPITIATSADALSSSGSYFYTLQTTNPTCTGGNQNNYKVRTDAALLYLNPTAFCFVAGSQTFADRFMIYPNYPDLSTTTVDGEWDVYLDVLAPIPYLEIWDGDFDYGSADCADNDTDDPDTPNGYLQPWMMGQGTLLEGVAAGTSACSTNPAQMTTGAPWDDSMWAFYRRSPSVTYDVIAPDGTVYHNANPSGNQEWEQFRIETDPSVPADYYVSNLLPAGAYRIHVTGLDLANLNAWYINHEVLSLDDTDNPFTRASELPLQGCTPGYWKSPQHQDSWVTYAPTDSFDAVFGVTSAFGGNLLEAMQRGGGGENAVGRFAAAALLNTTNTNVNFVYNEDEVIGLVRYAYATGDFAAVQTILQTQDEIGCPLN